MMDFGPCVLRRRAQWTMDQGAAVLEVPKFGAAGTRLLRVFRLPPTVRLRLDALSTQAWLDMEGRTGAEILARLEGAFPDEAGLPERLGRFLGLLVQRGLIEAAPAKT